MDIAALSTSISSIQLNRQINMSVLKMVMDTSEAQSVELLKMVESNTQMIEQMVTPYLGENIDIRA